jgi:hypothetical protein
MVGAYLKFFNTSILNVFFRTYSIGHYMSRYCRLFDITDMFHLMYNYESDYIVADISIPKSQRYWLCPSDHYHCEKIGLNSLNLPEYC